MEPVSTELMIKGTVAYVSEMLSKSESLNNFFSSFTEATVKWIKPIFLKEDGSEKKVILDLKENPQSPSRRKATESAIEFEIEKDSEAIKYISEIFEKISKENIKEINTNYIVNSSKFNAGSINSGGGDVRIG